LSITTRRCTIAGSANPTLWFQRSASAGTGRTATQDATGTASPNNEVPADVAKNRGEVISACIDSGINYLDITTAAECLCYGVAFKGRREKMIVGADIHNLGPRNPSYCNVKDQTRNVDTCLKHLQTDYLDIWRPQAKMDGSNTDAEKQWLMEITDKQWANLPAEYEWLRDWEVV